MPSGNVTAVVCFFSPCGYVLPKQHLQTTLRGLERQGFDVVCAQSILPGVPPEPVGGHALACYESSHLMFRKENLWNLASELTWASDKLLFIDSDILLEGDAVQERIAVALDHAELVQPFGTAQWERRDGTIGLVRPPAAFALRTGASPNPARFHPGFAWAVTRRALVAMRGFYDRHVMGGGDTMFGYALTPARDVPEVSETQSGLLYSAPSYDAYRRNLRSLDLRISEVEGIAARHLWHGDHKDRQYVKRGTFLPQPIDGEVPVTYREDGLMEWIHQSDSEGALAYFRARKEDG
jgi:hypothetical protein